MHGTAQCRKKCSTWDLQVCASLKIWQLHELMSSYSSLTYIIYASSLTDMPVAPHPVGSSLLGTLAPSSSSSSNDQLTKFHSLSINLKTTTNGGSETVAMKSSGLLLWAPIRSCWAQVGDSTITEIKTWSFYFIFVTLFITLLSLQVNRDKTLFFFDSLSLFFFLFFIKLTWTYKHETCPQIKHMFGTKYKRLDNFFNMLGREKLKCLCIYSNSCLIILFSKS